MSRKWRGLDVPDAAKLREFKSLGDALQFAFQLEADGYVRPARGRHVQGRRVRPLDGDPQGWTVICNHCGGAIEIRNPKGFCDHLYYPDYCPTCKRAASKPKRRRRRRCHSCGELKFDVKRRPDAYARDVWNDAKATHVVCNACDQASAEDI